MMKIAGGDDKPVVLETPRLRLRPHVHADLDDVAALWAEPSVIEYIMPKPLARSEAWTRLLRYVGHWAMLPYGYWVAEDRSSGEFLGEIGYADWKREIDPAIEGLPEIGWVMKPSAQGRGLAREGVRAALDWADRHIDAAETVALIRPVHEASLRLARDVGFGEPEMADFRGAQTGLLRRPLARAAS